MIEITLTKNYIISDNNLLFEFFSPKDYSFYSNKQLIFQETQEFKICRN